MPNYYPPVGFHFKVEVLDLPPSDSDVRFTEVSGLSVEMATEEVAEGGETRFTQKYPTRAKYSELVLKRGLLVNSEVIKWVRECIEDFKIQPKNIDVKLLKPEEGIFDKELANRAAHGPIEIDGFAPRCAVPVAKVRAELPQIISFWAEMVVHNIECDGEPMRVRVVHEALKRLRTSITILDGKRVDAVVSPVARARKLCDWH